MEIISNIADRSNKLKMERYPLIFQLGDHWPHGKKKVFWWSVVRKEAELHCNEDCITNEEVEKSKYTLLF